MISRECRENIAECYIPLMTTVFEAPPTSPLCTIDVNNMTSFILSLSAPVKPQVSCKMYKYRRPSFDCEVLLIVNFKKLQSQTESKII